PCALAAILFSVYSRCFSRRHVLSLTAAAMTDPRGGRAMASPSDPSRDQAKRCLAQAAVDPGASAAGVAAVARLTPLLPSAANRVASILRDIPSKLRPCGGPSLARRAQCPP
ncbi:unnamed protein product, partial [Urochloa humidicola]